VTQVVGFTKMSKPKSKPKLAKARATLKAKLRAALKAKLRAALKAKLRAALKALKKKTPRKPKTKRSIKPCRPVLLQPLSSPGTQKDDIEVLLGKDWTVVSSIRYTDDGSMFWKSTELGFTGNCPASMWRNRL
jgi:hypothetical protein